MKKLRRVGLPFLFVSTFFYISQIALGQRDVIMQPWQIYFYKYEIFWFIQAIIVLFALLAVADASRWFERPSAMLCAILLPLVIAPYLREVDLFSLGGATFLAPFFFAGVATHRFAKFTRNEMVGLVALLAIALAVHTENVLALPDGEQPIRETLLALVIGVSSSILLIYNAPHSAIISRIGRSSLPIFLYHIFFIAAAREVLQAAGVHSMILQVAAGLAIGIIGPLVVENVVARIPYLRMALLGLSPRIEKRRPVEELRA